jgi:hypothetical protein
MTAVLTQFVLRQEWQQRERQVAKIRQEHSVFPGSSLHIKNFTSNADQPTHAPLLK